MSATSGSVPHASTSGFVAVGTSLNENLGLLSNPFCKRVFGVYFEPRAFSILAPEQSVVVVAQSFGEAAEIAVEALNAKLESERATRNKFAARREGPAPLVTPECITSMSVVRNSVVVRSGSGLLRPEPKQILAAQRAAAKAVVADFPTPSPEQMDAEMRELDCLIC